MHFNQIAVSSDANELNSDGTPWLYALGADGNVYWYDYTDAVWKPVSTDCEEVG